MEWISIKDQQPGSCQDIVAKLNGGIAIQYCRMTIREGEGLGHIEAWLPIEDFIESQRESE